MIVTGSFILKEFYVIIIMNAIDRILLESAEFVVRQEVCVVANDRYN